MADEREQAAEPEEEGAAEGAGNERAQDDDQAREEQAPEERGEERPRERRAPRGAQGRAYIKSTFNNTIITITDQRGNTVTWASGGTVGFEGTRKGTPFAAQLAGENAARRAIDAGIRRLEVLTKGPGSGRETAVRAMQAVGIEVGDIRDVTATPHNGCRPKKRRRM
ncbi:MAG: 30S ribosomal protein S11 [Armatimonadota bacterium]|nr:30S ribosomal protein S11 [Armatimonadota bacterium]